jgi:imidazolonepropionase-like amidohydrolase
VTWIAGARLADPALRKGALHIDAGRIAARVAEPPRGAKAIDASGLILVPAFIDAHVHLAVAGDPALVSREQIQSGVAAVLDLGAPERLLPLDHPPLRIRFSGPLLTAPGGYPTRSWGRNGEGLELASADQARAAVQRLAGAGARFVKLALDPRFPMPAPELARAAADEAHRLGLLVAAHALEEGPVRQALEAGADVLAHTPRDPLPADLLERMQGKWVISTLHAFGVAPERLRALRDAGARVAYGTDLGNENTAPGIDARELALLQAAGIDPLPAATSEAAALLSLPDLGSLAPGASASLLAVRSLSPADLARPAWVMIDGTRIRPAAA